MKHEICGMTFEADGTVDQAQWDVLKLLLEREEMVHKAQRFHITTGPAFEAIWLDHDNDKQAFRRYVKANQDEAERKADLEATETGPYGLKIGRK